MGGEGEWEKEVEWKRERKAERGRGKRKMKEEEKEVKQIHINNTYHNGLVCTCSTILAALSTGSSGVLYSCVLSSSLCCSDFTRPLHSPWGSSDEA